MHIVESIDLSKYQGKWYQIALKPIIFQKHCNTDVTAQYDFDPETRTIRVENSCTTDNGRAKHIIGKARPSRQAELSEDLILTPAKLEVKFFPLQPWSPYWVVDLDTENYTWSVVSGPSGKYMWLLCRQPYMSDMLYETIISRLQERGISVEGLVRNK
jgi:apolipoprotein D and lipocalin family protein